MSSMIKLTLAVVAAAVTAGGHANAALLTVADYDFENNLAPAGFTAFGTPTYSGGAMMLDGASYIQAAAPLDDTTTDNFVLEAIVSATSFDNFDFGVAISSSPVGTNTGYALIAQGGNGGNWEAITMGSGFPGSTPHGGAPTGNVALAYVRNGGGNSLYVNGVQILPIGGGQNFNLSGSGFITIGANPFDANNNNGIFNGSIDRVRVSTFDAGMFDSNDLLGPNDGGNVIPEPSSIIVWSLLGIAAVGYGCVRRRKREQ